MNISFIVLTYNRCDALLAVLRSLATQCSVHHEILIADDGSSRTQVDMLYKNCPAFRCQVRHIWHPDVGFTAAAARNLGAYYAQGEYLVFMDGDCVPGKSFVQAHTLLAERGMLVNGSRVMLSERLTKQVVDQSLDLLVQPAAFWWKARLQGDSNKLLHMLYWPWPLFRVKQAFKWRGIRSCNLGVWKSDFVAVNGFDETFEGWGHEDADLVLRLSHLGVLRKNGFLATEVFHLWHQENQRSHASTNHKKVGERMKTGLVRAEKGLDAVHADLAVKITTLY